MFRLSQFSLKVPIPRFHSGYHITFICYVSSWFWDAFFLRCLLFYDKKVLRIIGQVWCRLSLIWDLPDVFLMIRLGNVFFGGRQQRSNAILISRVNSVNIALALLLLNLVQLVWTRFNSNYEYIFMNISLCIYIKLYF